MVWSHDSHVISGKEKEGGGGEVGEGEGGRGREKGSVAAETRKRSGQESFKEGTQAIKKYLQSEQKNKISRYHSTSFIFIIFYVYVQENKYFSSNEAQTLERMQHIELLCEALTIDK